MDRLRPAELGGEQDRGLIEVALARRRRTDAQGLIGLPHVDGVAIGFGLATLILGGYLASRNVKEG
jgi:hypothetical protein